MFICNKISTAALILMLGFGTEAKAECDDLPSSLGELWTLKGQGDVGGIIELATACEAKWLKQAAFAQMSEFFEGSCPPEGNVPEPDRPPIFANGILNDMGAVMLLLGEAHQREGDQSLARHAYSACVDLRCARVWNPQGPFFWAPFKACGANLQ